MPPGLEGFNNSQKLIDISFILKLRLKSRVLVSNLRLFQTSDFGQIDVFGFLGLEQNSES